MKKDTKKILIRVGIGVGVIIILLALLMSCNKPTGDLIPQQSAIPSYSSGGSTGSTTGGSSAVVPVPVPVDDDGGFWAFFRWIPDECSRDSDCNKCANADYDACVDGNCGCVAPVTEPTRSVWDSIFTRATPECSRDSDCMKCANPTYDACVDGTCGCVAPVVAPILTCTDTDGLDSKTFGTCKDNSGTIIANDYCDDGSTLNEASCGRGNVCVYTKVTCGTGRGFGCSSGVCI